jgi:CDP-diacylglycerol--serine O-phosphatidyltransferase
MKITRAAAPSFFTALNMYFGFLSIVQSHAGDFYYASVFIMVAAVFDSLDGVVARITKSTSQFGVELDSLADVVSFGVAPAFLVYRAHLSTLGHWGLLIASLPLIFGAIRLARFNVQLVGFDKEYFNGLPIPMQAITVAAFMLSYSTNASGLEEWARTALAPIVVVLSLLMVSTIKYDTMPKFSKKAIAAHPWKIAGSVAGVLIVFLSKGSYIFHLASAVIVFGIIRACVMWTRGRFNRKDDSAKQEAAHTRIDM